MFDSELTYGQHLVDNTCLTFFVLAGSTPGSNDDIESRQLAQTYCLETGALHWPGTPDRAPVSLRENDRLAEWEPMTPDKLAVIATDSGVAGPAFNLPGRIEAPTVSALVVSPQGFLMCWDEGFIRTSDVARLENAHEPLANTDDGWDEYYRTYPNDDASHIVAGPGFHGIPTTPAWVGNERTPIPGGVKDFDVNTLADCNRTAISPIEESGNKYKGDYTPEAARFVRHQLGVDPAAVDWQAAASARLINVQYAKTAPFAPTPARIALRHALNHRIPQNPARVGARKPARTHLQRQVRRPLSP